MKRALSWLAYALIALAWLDIGWHAWTVMSVVDAVWAAGAVMSCCCTAGGVLLYARREQQRGQYFWSKP